MYKGYILASYALTFLPLALLAAASLRQYFAAKRQVAALDAHA
jgi:heme exporter protein CcmD